MEGVPTFRAFPPWALRNGSASQMAEEAQQLAKDGRILAGFYVLLSAAGFAGACFKEVPPSM